jgi:hypothetical protein
MKDNDTRALTWWTRIQGQEEHMVHNLGLAEGAGALYLRDLGEEDSSGYWNPLTKFSGSCLTFPWQFVLVGRTFIL